MDAARLFIIIIFFCAALTFFFVSRWKKVRQKLDEFYPAVELLLEAQEKALDFQSGYLMKKDWDALVSNGRAVEASLLAIPSNRRALHKHADEFARFLDYQSNSEIRKERNSRFKEHELEATQDLLSDIDGKSLDAQQRDAVVTDEYSNLVIAGAGSGKTLTIVGKIKYLVERVGINPEDILVMSFTKKSAAELDERIRRTGIEGVTAKTFHSLGLGLLEKVGVANEYELNRAIHDYLRTELPRHPRQIQSYLDFYGCFSHLLQDYGEFQNQSDRYDQLKAYDLQTLKGRLNGIAEERKGAYSTLGGEKVKSLEELMIANFLFLHGVDYVYEKVYTGDYTATGRAYQPDFYLNEYDIWLEHFGIDEQGRAPWLKNELEEQKYIKGVLWKRSVHEKNGTRLIESYSFWNKDHDLLNKIERLLIQSGVKLAEDEERLARLYSQLSEDSKYHKSMVTLLQTFLSLAKANNLDMNEIEERGREVYREKGYLWHRFQLFMTFAAPILNFYAERLRKKNEIDFDDMINKAAAKVESGKTSLSYKYIIVDEYQDISKSRFGLAKAIRDECGAKLVCVGDDWQSIYRFAGSDVTLFMNFGKYAGFHETLRIEQTYRNSQELVDVASAFVEKNPSQVHKVMRARTHLEKPLIIIAEQDMASSFEHALDTILASRENYGGEILVLGRHNFDIENLYPGMTPTECMSFAKNYDTNEVRISYRGYDNIKYMSVHKAKGLEADDVIVLNLVNDRYGFPNQIEDDPILALLLDNEDNYAFAEERRLFYVAITRTKGSAYLISERINGDKSASMFIKELIADNDPQNSASHIALLQDEGSQSPVKCPRCGSGALVVRINKRDGRKFLGCTNYPFCDKTYDHIEILEDRIKCRKCGGWMVRKARKQDGAPFYGCSNYPDCNGIINIESDSYEYGVSEVPRARYRGRSVGESKNEYQESRKYNRNRSTRPSSVECPLCGAPMKKRKGPYGPFWGCSNFPQCKGKRKA